MEEWEEIRSDIVAVEEELVDMVAMAVKEVKELVLEQQLVAMDLVELEEVLAVLLTKAVLEEALVF